MSLIFDPVVYSLKAVKYAAFDCSSKASVQVESDVDGKIAVHIALKEGAQDRMDSLEKEFEDCVLEHQVRIEIGREYKLIRDMIIAQAFAPCDNLENSSI